MKSIILLGLLLIVSPFCYADDPVPTEITKGCLMIGTTTSRQMVFIFFVKVADSDYDSENGEPQIWGYNPEEVEKDKEGKIRFREVSAEKFVKAGRVGHLLGATCHCPAW